MMAAANSPATQAISPVQNEALLYSHINNEAMRGYASASHLFYLPGRKVYFRCCVHQNTNGNNPPYISRIVAAFKERFEPETLMGEILGELTYNPELDGKAVPMDQTEIPGALAERINKIASAVLENEQKRKAVSEAERQKAQEVLFSFMQNPKELTDAEVNKKLAEAGVCQAVIDEINDTSGDNILKFQYEVGAEFAKYAVSKQIRIVS